MLVKHYMTTPAIALGPEDDLLTAAKQMETYKIGAIVVVDDTNRPIGMVTDRDIITRGIAYDLPLTTPLKEVMSKRLYVIKPEESITLATMFMGAKQVKRLIVIDDDYQLVGVLSLGDLAQKEYHAEALGETLIRISYPYTDWINNPHYGVQVDEFRL